MKIRDTNTNTTHTFTSNPCLSNIQIFSLASARVSPFSINAMTIRLAMPRAACGDKRHKTSVRGNSQMLNIQHIKIFAKEPAIWISFCISLLQVDWGSPHLMPICCHHSINKSFCLQLWYTAIIAHTERRDTSFNFLLSDSSYCNRVDWPFAWPRVVLTPPAQCTHLSLPALQQVYWDVPYRIGRLPTAVIRFSSIFKTLSAGQLF